jgi:hypothetical protein
VSDLSAFSLRATEVSRRGDDIPRIVHRARNDVSEQSRSQLTATVPPSVVRILRRMALDAVTVHVVNIFQDRGLPCMLLKGPAIAARLYADDISQRDYTDIDLLVPPRLFGAAGDALRSIGFVRAQSGPSPKVGSALFEESWRMVGNSLVVIDLHRGFHGVGRQEPFWDLLYEPAGSLRVGGTDVAVPDAAGCALLVALHVWTAGSAKRPMVDLQRALDSFDDAVWRQASEIAARCDALAVFTFGLGRRPEGAELTHRLGLSTAAAPAIWLRSTPEVDGAAILGALLFVPGWHRRAVRSIRLVFPGVGYMRRWATGHPVGRPAHPPGLVAAYGLRLAKWCRSLPSAVRAWRASSRAAAESGWAP